MPSPHDARTPPGGQDCIPAEEDGLSRSSPTTAFAPSQMGGNTIPPSDDESIPGDRIGRSRPAHLPLMNAPWAGNVLWFTVCVGSPRVRLDRDDVHHLLVSIWSTSTSHWLVGDYVLMPDHLHFFAAPRSPTSLPLKNWMKWWRQEASTHWPRPEEAPIWQRDYWDRQLRHDEIYTEKWHYLRNNPVRAKLVASTEDWPFQGRIHSLTL